MVMPEPTGMLCFHGRMGRMGRNGASRGLRLVMA